MTKRLIDVYFDRRVFEDLIDYMLEVSKKAKLQDIKVKRGKNYFSRYYTGLLKGYIEYLDANPNGDLSRAADSIARQLLVNAVRGHEILSEKLIAVSYD